MTNTEATPEPTADTTADTEAAASAALPWAEVQAEHFKNVAIGT